MNTGARIRMLRKRENLTLTDVANQIGMTSAGLSLIELGKRRITTEQIELLAKALRVKPGDFFDPELNVTSQRHKEASDHA
jgi:transcriptional regulator with XRE-family HTH domain